MRGGTCHLISSGASRLIKGLFAFGVGFQLILLSEVALLCFGCSSSASNDRWRTSGPEAQSGARVEYWPTEAWRPSTPEREGMDPALLRKAHIHIEKELANFRSLLVIRNGYIVYEAYYHGLTEDALQPTRSVTKSFLSALVAIAIEKKHLQGPDQKLSDIFPEHFTKESDPLKKEITLRHLLTMTSGLFSAETERNWGSNSGRSWVESILNRPMAGKPGEQFYYGVYSWPAHLLSAGITKKTGMSAREFADRHLFGPLGIGQVEWATDPEGFSIGPYGLNLTSRDMAKFGYLFLKKGRWEGKQIIPPNWVEEATRKHNDGGLPERAGYGYLWWVSEETGHPAYFAAGYGGQFIYVIPALDLVVVTTGESRIGPSQLTDHRHVIREFIAPAVKGR
ncbi:MAG TPA: serine hydrolase [Blastocatellia bacterium]|nr:serine hydrolase [Blastocatellia bacterium]